MTRDIRQAIAKQLLWPLRLTWAGLWAERVVRGFWPVWSLVLSVFAALILGLHDLLPQQGVLAGAAIAGLVMLWALVRGLRRFARPTRAEALARLDAALPGRPIATLADHQAIGGEDPASRAVWAAHLARMARVAATARPVRPDLRLATRDRFGLRYMALTALITALIFGSLWRIASVAGLGAGPAQALIAGPSWEGWVQPPPYTGKPSLYLNDIELATFQVPVGSRVQLRFYGKVGALTLDETVSGRTDTPPDPTDPSQAFEISQSGAIGIVGPGGRTWNIIAQQDAPPVVSASSSVTREADGRMKLPFNASDDYGVIAGQAEIALDLASVDRRYGLAAEPEPVAPVVLDLPLPITASRAEFDETLIEDLSKHPFANLPVTIRLSVSDAADQTGTTGPLRLVLPGKRFFEPLAAAVIELRRDLLWARGNAPRTVQILRAITNKPEGFVRNERAWLRLRVVLRRLEAEAADLTVAARDDLADALWEIALLIEEGDLASAREKLKRAQDRLDEAIRNGADPSEIENLMQDLREAMNDYIRQLAEEAQRNPDGQAAQEQQGMQMTGDQLQQMLEELQKLLQEGRTDEAAALMEMLRQLMENIQVTQGEGGQGGPGQQAMRDLGDTLRDQQGLSDDSFSELQKPGTRNGQQGQDGQPDPQPGQQGDTGEGQQNGQGADATRDGGQAEGQNERQGAGRQGLADR